MKVIGFIRKFICVLSIMAAILGAIYFYLFYTDKRFEELYGSYDERIIAIIFSALIGELLLNLIYTIIVELTIGRSFNRTVFVKGIVLVAVTFVIGVAVPDAVGLCLIGVPLGIMGYEIGNIIEIDEVHEVDFVIED